MIAYHLFRKPYRKFVSNCRGVSLAELLVSMAILAIASIPFLGSFITAQENNSRAKNSIVSTVMAQKAMDDIKSRPLFLSAMSGQGNKLYSSDGEYRVECRVTEEQPDTITGDNEYNFDINALSFSQEFSVSRDSVMLNGFSYDLQDVGAAKKYYLNIAANEITGAFRYAFSDNYDSVLQTGELTAVDAINEKICFDKTGSGRFELHVTVDPAVDREVNLYSVDDLNSGMLFVNDGEIPVNLYCCASGSRQSYTLKLYRVEISVYKGQEPVNTLVSFVKK